MRGCLHEHLQVRKHHVLSVMVRQLVLYGRPECHLCDEARELLAELVEEAGDIALSS
jgi:hypothetical protein